MSGFTQVFGGSTIAPANATFLSLVMTGSIELAWPIEQAINGNVVADTIEVSASTPGLSVDLPDARQVSTGYTTCFNNTGSNTVTVRNAVGATLLSLVSGTTWVIYLADNSTEGGTWRVFQLGASVSVAVAAALAGPGLKAITTTLAQDVPITGFNITPTTLIDADRAKFLNWTGGLGTLNLPSPVAVGNGWFVQIRNTGSGDLTVTPPAGTIDGAATKTFAAGTSATVVTDGTNFYTLGFGSGVSGGGSFDFVEIDVAGSGNFTLAGANLNRVAYRFVGVLTGNRTIIVPNAIQQYWVANATTGAFSLFVRTAGQTPPGIEVLQNNQSIMYCDSNNVIDAESSTVSFPIPVAQGGTGAVTAATARTNLGATVTGNALFIAADATAARTAIAAVPTARAVNTGSGLLGGGDLSADRTLTVDRTGVDGVQVGYLDIPIFTPPGVYSSALSDRGKCIYHSDPFAGGSYAITGAIFPVGACISLMNNSAAAITITNSETMYLANTSSTGGRVLNQRGFCTLIKFPSYWIATGVGLL